MLVSSRSAAKPRADVQRILLEDGNHTTVIRKKKDCRLTSIVIGEVLLVPGEEGAPPGTRHSRFGDAIRRADHGAILPSKVQDFCGPLPTFSFCVGLVFPGGSKLLPKGKRVGW